MSPLTAQDLADRLSVAMFTLMDAVQAHQSAPTAQTAHSFTNARNNLANTLLDLKQWVIEP